MNGNRWHVEKRSYSRNPWRLIHTATGLQITYSVPYPGHAEVPLPPIAQAGFPRKRDAVAYAETLDWDDIERRMRHEGVFPRERAR